MEQLSFLEKLEVLFQNILAHPFFICILLVPVFLMFFSKKITKKAVILIYIGVLAIVLFVGNITIFSLFDNLVDGIFMALYFPNFITLFIVEVVSAIICLITFLKKDIIKINKIINVTGFSIIQTIFVLILTVIQANDIDIYQENALYASNDVLTLMQLLMGTFALQIITLLVVMGIDRVTAKLDGTEEKLNKHTMKLPEGRITHVNLQDKIIIKKPEVIKEKEIIVKEPDVKLDPVRPLKPLDKSLLNDVKINPIDVNEEVAKEKNKPNPTIKKETTEVLGDIESKKVTKQEKKEVNPFDDFKPEFPIDKQPKFVNKENLTKKPDLLKPMEDKKEEKELIANLQIVDFEKMVHAIKNLSIIYTM